MTKNDPKKIGSRMAQSDDVKKTFFMIMMTMSIASGPFWVLFFLMASLSELEGLKSIEVLVCNVFSFSIGFQMYFCTQGEMIDLLAFFFSLFRHTS